MVGNCAINKNKIVAFRNKIEFCNFCIEKIPFSDEAADYPDPHNLRKTVKNYKKNRKDL